MPSWTGPGPGSLSLTSKVLPRFTSVVAYQIPGSCLFLDSTIFVTCLLAVVIRLLLSVCNIIHCPGSYAMARISSLSEPSTLSPC